MYRSDEDVTADATRLPLVEIAVRYELDSTTVPRLAELFDDALVLRPVRLVVDLTDCPFIDASAITLLLQVHRHVWAQGGLLLLRGPSERVLRTLDLAGVRRVFSLAAPAPQDARATCATAGGGPAASSTEPLE